MCRYFEKYISNAVKINHVLGPMSVLFLMNLRDILYSFQTVQRIKRAIVIMVSCDKAAVSLGL
jgi:hypothetical protein